jgi:dTDP-glucose 4,6-dehydratase
LEGGKVPVYGKGKNVREWLYVDDCARGILVVANKGRIGEIYNLGSNQESQNINTVKLLLKTIGVSKNRLEFVKDRLGHDFRYSLNFDKLTKEIGWRPSIKLNVGLKLTIAWALEHESWLKSKLRDINKLYRDCPRRSLSGVT